MFDTPEKLYLVVVSDYPNAWWRFIVKTKIDQIDAERKAMSGAEKCMVGAATRYCLPTAIAFTSTMAKISASYLTSRNHA